MRWGDLFGRAAGRRMNALVRMVLMGAGLALSGAALSGAAAEADAVPEPDGYRTDDYRAPVPRTLEGARVIDGEEAEQVVKDGKALLIDVYPQAKKPPNLPEGTIWRDPTHKTIEGAHWLPNVGYGVLSEEFENYFRTRLATLTENDRTRPLVFFCQRDCWMSWNAAKRARAWGYTDVIWFPDGTDAWQEQGHDLVKAVPVP